MQVRWNVVQFEHGAEPEHLRFDFLHARQAVETRFWNGAEVEEEEEVEPGLV